MKKVEYEGSIFPIWYFALSRLPRFLFEVHVMPPSSPSHRTWPMGPSVHKKIKHFFLRVVDAIVYGPRLILATACSRFRTPYPALGLSL